MKNHNFYVYPTLVDSLLWMQRIGTPEKKQELIDKINRVPFDMPDFVKKGTTFEECVNLRLTGQKVYSKDGFNTGTQKWIEKTVSFRYGNVRIGGFLDYNYDDKIVDLKTTSNYRLGKYTGNMQHKAYGLIQPEKKEFIYLATDFENMYIEPYKNKVEHHEEFIFNVEELYRFCEENKELITDLRIYGN